MALRLASKIRCSVVQSLTRTFAAKPEPTSTAAAPQQQGGENAEQGEAQRPLKRFNVYQASGLTRTPENENMLRQQMDNRQLQPSMLPDYYKPEIDVQHATYPIPDTLAHTAEPLSLKQRRFEVSKTYANVTLPLKMPKLASPFPDPVKIMSSHTISDQEKAEQMLAESRVPRASAEPPVAKCAAPNRVQTRNYSSKGKTVGRDDKKCKKVGKQKKKCVKMVAPGCIPPKSISCEREAKPIKCKKIHAPYPAYSEACYEEVPEKPSECKLCPWRPNENPNFKPPKKKYHTSAEDLGGDENTTVKRRGEEAGYQLDARKKPCKDPNAKKPDKKKKKKKSGSGGSKKKSSKKSKKKKKKSGKKATGWTNAVRAYNEAQEESDIVINQKAIQAEAKKKSGKKKKKRPCKKFPFDKCKQKDHKKKPKDDKCKKKKKPIIKGCLGEDSWETVAVSENTLPNAMELSKCSKKDRCEKKEKKKMPNVGKKKKKGSKDKKKSGDEPCPQKKPGSRKCPADLEESAKRRKKIDRSDKRGVSGQKQRPAVYFPKGRQLQQETQT